MDIKVGDIIEGSILNITDYGAFVKIDENTKGLVHISEVSNSYVKDINQILKVGQIVKVKVLSTDNNKLALSIKQTQENVVREPKKDNKLYKNNNKVSEPQTFEDILSKFMKDSEERQTDLKRSFESKRGSSTKRV